MNRDPWAALLMSGAWVDDVDGRFLDDAEEPGVWTVADAGGSVDWPNYYRRPDGEVRKVVRLSPWEVPGPPSAGSSTL